jgi:hypothetical protein
MRATLQDWMAVENDPANAVAASCKMIELETQAVMDGRERMLLVSGPTSVGKSFLVKRTIPRRHAPLICNPGSYLDLLPVFAEAGRHRPIIFEEGDFCLKSERVLNILKIASDPTPGNRQYNNVWLTAPIFMLCNADIARPYERKTKFAQHWDALFRRSNPIIVPNDRMMLWEYACHLAITKGMLKKTERGKPISRAIADEALDFFTQNLWKLHLVGPGVLVEIGRIMCEFSGFQRDYKLAKLIGDEAGSEPTPQSPRILVK